MKICCESSLSKRERTVVCYTLSENFTKTFSSVLKQRRFEKSATITFLNAKRNRKMPIVTVASIYFAFQSFTFTFVPFLGANSVWQRQNYRLEEGQALPKWAAINWQLETSGNPTFSENVTQTKQYQWCFAKVSLFKTFQSFVTSLKTDNHLKCHETVHFFEFNP